MSTATVDYVVVGSGAGGGPLAANLARAGHRVLLLEAGDDHGDRPTYQVPALHGLATEDKHMQWDYFVQHYTDPARQRLDSKYDAQRQGVWYPRAGTLGGCTAHNAMITVYPHNSDWDALAQLTGDASWAGGRMRAYFERLERCEYVEPPAGSGTGPTRHGFHGWLTTSKADPKLAANDPQLLKTVATAALTALMSQVRNPRELAAHLVASGKFKLTQIVDILRLLQKDPFDPAAVAATLFDNSQEFLERLLDPNDWEFVSQRLEGLCIVPLAVGGGKQDPARRGRRNGPREYIRATQQEFPDRLDVWTNVLVTRVLFQDNDPGNRATGVALARGAHLYRADPNADAAGPTLDQLRAREETVHVRREVILAAGAFNTPQLLMLSGIGPKEELARHKIPLRVELPGVGQNLQDRYEVGVLSDLKADFKILQGASFTAPEPGPDYQAALAQDPALRQWDRTGTGLYATNGAVLGIIAKSSPDKEDADLFIFGLPGYFKGYFQTYSQKFEERRDRFTWAILKAHTANRAGSVTLRSADPRDVPGINFRYFGDGNDQDPAAREDLKAVVAGVQLVRKMTGLNRFVTEKVTLPGEKDLPLGEVDENTIADFVKKEAWGHHACGTCRVGAARTLADLARDPGAVLTSNFEVLGTKGLRVVDASVFPRIPGFFIVTPIYMVSEKASDVILAAAR